MAKPWRLTRHAEAALADIASWTYETFGPHQAEAYEEDLIGRGRAIADGSAPSQSCRALVDAVYPGDVGFTRAGGHFIVFLEDAEAIVILDFLHARSDLPARLSWLTGRREG